MGLVEIDDAARAELGVYTSLTDAEARRHLESGPDGVCIVEGATALARLLNSPYPVHSVLITPAKAERHASLLARLPAQVPVFVAPPALLESITGFAVHRGVLACAHRLPDLGAAQVVAEARHLMVVEGVNDHENLGSLYRTAAALGIGGVLLCPRTADPLYRRSIRVSQGWALRLPTARVDPWPDGLSVVTDAGVRLVALTPAADAVPVAALAAAQATDGPTRWALMVGAEGPGLTDSAMAASSVRACIPVRPEVDSLNVAVAFGVAAAMLVDSAV